MTAYNVSLLPDALTAHTDPECARQRADNLAILGARSVLELCVGPSLRIMEEAYGRHGMTVTGNDIDARWIRHHPEGRWIIGDALTVDPRGFDAVVFAPPLSHGCTGRRGDSLSVCQVTPGYRDFMTSLRRRSYPGQVVMVLPARALAPGYDSTETYDLLAQIGHHEVVPLYAGRRRIRKYVDVYLRA